MTLVRLTIPEADGFQVIETPEEIRRLVSITKGPMVSLTLVQSERRQTIALRAEYILSAVEL